MTPVILTMGEAAERMKIPPRAVIRLCRLGQLPGARKAGRSWRVPEDAITAFFAAPAKTDEELEEEAERPAAPRAEGGAKGKAGRPKNGAESSTITGKSRELAAEQVGVPRNVAEACETVFTTPGVPEPLRKAVNEGRFEGGR